MGPVWSVLPALDEMICEGAVDASAVKQSNSNPLSFRAVPRICLRQLPTRLWKLKEHTQKTRWQIKNADSEHRRIQT
jgi:hypothetical protein